MTERVLCERLTAKNEPCKNPAVPGSNPPICRTHLRAELEAGEDPALRNELKELFLERYAESLNLSAAAKAIGIDRKTLYNWRDTDPNFARRIEETRLGCVNDIEESLFKRAVGLTYEEVTLEPARIIRKGGDVTIMVDGDQVSVDRHPDEIEAILVPTKVVRKTIYDTRAAEILLRAHDPARFGNDESQRHSVERNIDDEKRMQHIQQDPQLRAQLDALLDADLP